MKTISKFLGLPSLLLTLIAIFFKIQHYQGGNVLICIGGLGLVIYFGIYALNGSKFLLQGLERTTGIIAAASMILAILVLIFKTLKWEGSMYLAVLAEILIFFTGILIFFDSIKETDQSKQSLKTLIAFSWLVFLAILVSITF